MCVFLGLPQAVHALRQGDLLETFPLWQLRLVVDLWDSRMLRGAANHHDALLTSEFLPVMKNMVDRALDSWLKGEDGDSAVSFLQRFCLGLDYTVVVSLSSLLEKTIRRFLLECEYFSQEHSSGRVVIVTAVFFLPQTLDVSLHVFHDWVQHINVIVWKSNSACVYTQTVTHSIY